MKFRADIDIMPQEALLDPQGKTVNAKLQDLELGNVTNVRVGKHIRLDVEAEDQKAAEKSVEEACKQVLTNPVMESYSFEVKQVEEG